MNKSKGDFVTIQHGIEQDDDGKFNAVVKMCGFTDREAAQEFADMMHSGINLFMEENAISLPGTKQ